MKIDVTIKHITPTFRLITNQLCIVNHLVPLTLGGLVEINAQSFTENPVLINGSMRKGELIKVHTPVFNYLKTIQKERDFRLAVYPGHDWINRRYSGEYGEGGTVWPPLCEPICAGYGNFLQIIQTIKNSGGTWHEVLALRNTEDFTAYNPKLNWMNYPDLVGKETARRADGSILNPGFGQDVYFPHLKREAVDHLWIHGDFVELFPPAPSASLGWILEGASIYYWNGVEKMPLRLARKIGELVHPTDWKLQTPSVVPPA